jgi:hypothetical protein|tara:strand:+ start:2013 stop:2243 length:231 start_codon:yes stop_codon:yes gene_type:complete
MSAVTGHRVEVQYRDVFGRPLCYPMNPTAARFCTLTGNLTLSTTDLQVIEALGFTVVPVMYAPGGFVPAPGGASCG